jgi:hypothetical protein
VFNCPIFPEASIAMGIICLLNRRVLLVPYIWFSFPAAHTHSKSFLVLADPCLMGFQEVSRSWVHPTPPVDPKVEIPLSDLVVIQIPFHTPVLIVYRSRGGASNWRRAPTQTAWISSHSIVERVTRTHSGGLLHLGRAHSELKWQVGVHTGRE